MTGSRLIGIVVAVLVLGAIAYFTLPGFRAKANELYEKHGGWNEKARKDDPVGFIDYSIKKLDENVGKFQDMRTDLASSKAKLDDMKRSNQEKAAFAEKNLAEFKSSYQTATGGKGWPVSMAGKSYTEPELKNQVELLLTQKTGYETALAQIDEVLKRAEEKGNALAARVNESKTKLEMLKTQKELVKINQLDAATEKMMAEVNDVLIRNDTMQSSTSVRTVEELMKESKVAAKATPKADDFLKS